MFEKLGRLAEGLASNVSTSRRGFLGRVGKTALGVAGGNLFEETADFRFRHQRRCGSSLSGRSR